MKKILQHRLYIIVFVTGACVMMLEITGSRVLAPYFGTSTIVWTSLIGLILASLSLGYWWGGRLADRKPSMALLGTLVVWSALGVALLAIVKTSIARGITLTIDDIRIGSVLVTLILFCPPSILLATVSPYAARLSIYSTKTSGETVGRLYALSTLGSIVGTFLAGFVLLSVFGNTMLLLVIAIVLLLVGVLSLIGHWNSNRLFLLFSTLIVILFGIMTKDRIVQTYDLLADVDTTYQRVQVYDRIDTATGRPARFLQTDSFGIQSARFIDTTSSEELVFPYTKFYRLADLIVPHPEHILMIGGAAYSVPRDMRARHPNAVIDVAEIDPGMTRLARDFFDLNDDARLNHIHMDGRIVLAQAEEGTYDTILIDAFHSVMVPFQLTTQEAVEEMYRALDDEGVVVVNVISAVEGRKGRFLQAEVETYSSVFPYVIIYPVRTKDDPELIQNHMIVASKKEQPERSDDPQLQSYLEHRWKGEIEEGQILTDDYAPVENYLLDMIR